MMFPLSMEDDIWSLQYNKLIYIFFRSGKGEIEENPRKSN